MRNAALAQIPIATAKEFAASGQQFARLESEFGVELVTTPPDVVEAEMKAIDTVLTKLAGENPAFARVVHHIKEFASKTSAYQRSIPPFLATRRGAGCRGAGVRARGAGAPIRLRSPAAGGAGPRAGCAGGRPGRPRARGPGGGLRPRA